LVRSPLLGADTEDEDEEEKRFQTPLFYLRGFICLCLWKNVCFNFSI
jgi:hypothetical protein